MSVDVVGNEAKIAQDKRSNRLKVMRKITGLSRKVFAEKHGMSQGTLQNWETSRFGGLTEKGARKVLKALQVEGVHCSFEWLMYGFGDQPNVSSSKELDSQSESTTNMVFSIDDELRFMINLHPNSIYLLVDDNSMMPSYRKGDVVLGGRLFGDDISTLLRTTCIIERLDGSKALRYLRQSSVGGYYDLIATQPDNARIPVEVNVELLSAAPIIWVRSPSF